MPLTPGARIGPYEVTGALGAGGMGEVYRARDTRLGRDVALKLLPPALSADPDRLRRFEREAKTLAALNHPHIAQIYGVETMAAGGQGDSAIVMELVAGRTLGRRQSRRGVDVSKTRCRSRRRSPTRSRPRTTPASSIATSNPPTSSSATTAS